MSSDQAGVQIESRHDLFPVELLDHQFSRVARSYGRLNAEVSPGIYLARCETGGPAVERLVKVAAGQTVRVSFTDESVYTQPSAAPVPGSISRHEFYTYPAHELVEQEKADFSHGSGARLTLFATQLDFAAKQDWNKGAPPVHWKGTKLRDAQGNALCELLGDESRKEDGRKRGYAGFCADLQPGGYFLEWPPESDDDRLVLQPLWLAQNWTTRLFAGARGEDPHPQRDTASIHMLRLGLPTPVYDVENDRANGAVELALASLRTGRRQLGDDLLRVLLHSKFENPMLGLLGAHMLLQRTDLNRPLFDEVCANLHGMLGPHPDLWALLILARSRFDHPLLPGPTIPAEVDFPPMLRDGLMAIDDAQWDQKQNLKLTATASLARLRVLAEGPWTLFWHAQPEAELAAVVASQRKFLRDFPGALALLRDAGPPPLRLSEAFPGFFDRNAFEDHYFSNAPLLAKIGTLQELGDYLRNLQQRRGISALHSLRLEDLRWTGLSPADVNTALNAFQAKLRNEQSVS